MRILSVLCLYVSCWVIFGSIIDDRSFINRENSVKLLELANQKLLLSDVHEVLSILKTSFQYYPTATVARKLAWLCDMLGDSHGTYFWQQNQARLDNPLILSWLNEGIQMHYRGEYYHALEYYDMILNVDPSNVDALYHKGVSYQYLGDIQNAADFYYSAIELEPTHSKAILNLAALHQKYGSYEDAVSYYLKGVELFANLTAVISEPEPVGQPEGELQPSKKLPYLHPHQIMVHYNLGLAYMQLNQLDKAYQITKQLLDTLYSIEYHLETDTTAAIKDQYNAWEIKQSIGGALGSLSKIQRASLNWGNWEWLNEQQIIYTLLGITHNYEHYCDNLSPIQDKTCDIEDYYKHKRKVPFLGPLLPFDTLMMPLSPSIRLEIATATSLSYLYQPYQSKSNDEEHSPEHSSGHPSEYPTEHSLGYSTEHSLEHSLEDRKREGVLRLGFISYDFTDHPTAHLIEAIFLIIAAAQKGCNINNYDIGSNNNSSYSSSYSIYVDVANQQHNHTTTTQSECKTSLFRSVELIVFSYGKDDNSRYRQSIQALAHKFVDIVQMSFHDAAEVIRTEEIDILLDLQIHTLGSRLEITAAGVAPTVINYLVFPGTSGASFYHYICADEVVIPPEHASFYSEALLLLPATYQISSYDHIESPPELVATVVEIQQQEEQQQGEGFVEETERNERNKRNRKTAMRKLFGLPVQDGAVVLCNFNKINKVDPESFALWVQVMRAVPSSYLWLIEPSHAGGSNSSSKASLLRAMAAEGVEAKRVIFAPKMSKSAHIFRHGAADLFLDTVVYGAHSTATDALRGGLPVLTLRGEAFPARVAASLYASLAYPVEAQVSTLGVHGRDASDSDMNSDILKLKRRQQHELQGDDEVEQQQYAVSGVLGEVLVTDSAKDFVDTAVRLVHGYYRRGSRKSSSTKCTENRDALAGLTQHLKAAIDHSGGLFNSTHNVEIFVRSMQVVKEIYSTKSAFNVPLQKRFHAILR